VLPGLFAEVLVSEAVLAECLARPDRPEGPRIFAALSTSALTRCANPSASTDWGLGPEEAASIGLAIERGAGLLADDRAARRVASALEIPLIGVLGVLVLAKRAGAIPAIHPVIRTLIDSGYFLANPLVEQVLRQAGE
jgi:predicted nucleic acid-binding protein